MGAETGIEWTDRTWSPWGGCQAVSQACDNCYAEALDKRTGHANRWGPHGTRESRVDAYYRQPLRWNAQAAATGQTCRVFPSMCDPFDNHRSITDAMRQRMWDIIRATPALIWQLLTKRPQNIARMLPEDWGDGWPNVWLGCTAENQEEADRRIPHLLRVPAVVRFLSCEPLLGPIRLWGFDEWEGRLVGPAIVRSGGVTVGTPDCPPEGYDDSFVGIDWIIVGGESGPGARPMHPTLARSLRDQCAAAGVPYFHKQNGEWRPVGPIYYEDDTHLDEIISADEMRCKVVCVDGYVQGDWEGQPPLGSWMMERVGKKSAGSLLDGREHKAFPHA